MLAVLPNTWLEALLLLQMLYKCVFCVCWDIFLLLANCTQSIARRPCCISSQQMVAKSCEDGAAGRKKTKASPSVVDTELQAAADKQQTVMSVTASM